MWRIEYPIETDLPRDEVWRALVALETGAVPKANGDRHALNGAFEVGGTMTSSSEGIPPILSTIVELVGNERMAIETDFRGLILLLRHTVTSLPGGGSRLVRSLEITGSSADQQAEVAGPRISDDYAEAIAEVIEVARRSLPSQTGISGSCWFRALSAGDVMAEIHLGVDDPFTPAARAHPALVVDTTQDLEAMGELSMAITIGRAMKTPPPWARIVACRQRAVPPRSSP